eukprot:3807344-Amphidinium_carterae.1
MQTAQRSTELTTPTLMLPPLLLTLMLPGLPLASRSRMSWRTVSVCSPLWHCLSQTSDGTTPGKDGVPDPSGFAQSARRTA